jgi:hypothetical protein
MSSLNQQTIKELIHHRNSILDHLESIKSLLGETNGCEKEYPLAVSHYIPQIVTALYSDPKYLQRGEYTLQETINHLCDILISSEKPQKGVKKYIF